MQIQIENKTINKNSVSVNQGLNYGRFNTENTKDHKIHLNLKDFVQYINDDYMRIKQEIKLDDIKYKDTSDFALCHYCSLEKLLKQPKLLNEIFITWFDRILYAKLFNQTGEIKFIVNSTEQIQKQNDTIIITGKVIEK